MFGLAFHFCAFYWLPYTITFFGGFPKFISYFIFLLYGLFFSIQFLICAWFYKKLKASFMDKLYLSFPCAWFLADFVMPKLFPWKLVHTQLVLLPFSSLAEFFGTNILTFIFIFFFSFCYSIIRKFKQSTYQLSGYDLGLVIVFVYAISMGNVRSNFVMAGHDKTEGVRVGIVQGNLEAKKKGDIKYFETNVETYRKLTMEAVSEGAQLIIWPESVVNQWTPESIKNVLGTRFDPIPDLKVPILFGTLSYRSDKEKPSQSNPDNYHHFNTALGLDSNKNVIGVYHKKILMPLGEYIPFASYFPSLKKLSPQTGEFSFGDKDQPLTFELDNNLAVRLSILICYEDLVPSLSSLSSMLGGQVLVNLTNDAWYGDTYAPHQHNLIASWRSIEQRRYLIRSTNTGFTSVINPLGEIVKDLKPFTSDYIIVQVKSRDLITFYAKYGKMLELILCILVCFVFVFSMFGCKE